MREYTKPCGIELTTKSRNCISLLDCSIQCLTAKTLLPDLACTRDLHVYSHYQRRLDGPFTVHLLSQLIPFHVSLYFSLIKSHKINALKRNRSASVRSRGYTLTTTAPSDCALSVLDTDFSEEYCLRREFAISCHCEYNVQKRECAVSLFE